MSAVEQRLADAGFTLPEVAAPVASYVPARQDGDLIYTSGQLPLEQGKLNVTGRLGAEVSVEEAQRLAQVCILNAIAAVKQVVGDLDKVTRVVRVGGFVASEPTFFDQPQVINGASDLLGVAFGEEVGAHARFAVGVAALPLNAPVEIDMTVSIAE